jgi:hypothetical protein
MSQLKESQPKASGLHERFQTVLSQWASQAVMRAPVVARACARLMLGFAACVVVFSCLNFALQDLGLVDGATVDLNEEFVRWIAVAGVLTGVSALVTSVISNVAKAAKAVNAATVAERTQPLEGKSVRRFLLSTQDSSFEEKQHE